MRERAQIGDGSLVGRGSVVENDVVLGARVRVQTNVYLTAFTLVEDDVFVGPGVMTTNDDTMSRHPPGAALRGRSCDAPAGSAAAPCCGAGSRSARRPSWRPGPS